MYYPDTGGELVFYHRFEEEDAWKGIFDDDEEREQYLTEAVKAIHNKIQLEKE